MARKKTGPPSQYSAALAEKLPDMFKDGESVAEVCAKLGITRNTFYKYVKKHPAFAEAYEAGKDLSEAWWTRKGRMAVSGQAAKMDTTAWIFNMKNRFGWVDKRELSGPDKGAIPIAASISFVGVTTDGRRRSASDTDGSSGA